MTELETYIPLSQAAVQFGLAERALRRMVENGIIRAVRFNEEMIVVAERDVQAATMRDQLWGQVKHLDDVPIGMSEACEKYPEINFASLSRWVQRGYIRTIESVAELMAIL